MIRYKNNSYLKYNKISIVTVVRNANSSIEQTILSVFSQTYKNIEYIVIDGASSDGTITIINKYLDKIAYFVSEVDKGIYDAMNKAVAVANGEYIVFLNAGDVFFDKHTLEYFDNFGSRADIVYGNAYLVEESGKTINYIGDISKILSLMPFDHQACFVKKTVFNYIKFDLAFSIAADYDFFLRAHKKKFTFEKIDLIVSKRKLDGVSNNRRFLSSVEAIHALLRYDDNIDVTITNYFSKIIVEHILGAKCYSTIKQIAISMLSFKSTPLYVSPIKKFRLLFFSIFLILKLFATIRPLNIDRR